MAKNEPMSSEEEDDLGLKPNTIIDTSKAKYVVERMLGEGGFGAVYKVHQVDDPKKEYAMKVEKKLETRKHSKLKMEIAILKEVQRYREELERKNKSNKRASHFTAIIDRSKKDTFTLIVMQLLGKSLADLKGQRPDKVFSTATGLGVGMQCLEAIHDLHAIKFVHRDIKPANYAVGLDPNAHVVYILDFGIARKFVKNNDELKTPRVGIGFKGTVRFASLACHIGNDVGRKDDLESWFYLLIDISIVKGLPWRKMSDKSQVRDAKNNLRTNFVKEYHELKHREELNKIFTYIIGIGYEDDPDYDYIYRMIDMAGKVAGVDITIPYDFEREKTSSVMSKVN